MKVFSARLKWLREKNNMSQQNMAERLGVSQSFYGRFEREQSEPSLETLAKLPEVLGEPLDFFLGLTDYTREVKNLYDQYYKLNLDGAILTEKLSRLADSLEQNDDPDYKKVLIDQYSILKKQIEAVADKSNEIRQVILEKIDEIPFADSNRINI